MDPRGRVSENVLRGWGEGADLRNTPLPGQDTLVEKGPIFSKLDVITEGQI